MRENLENLWFDYLIEAPIGRSAKENDIIKKWSEKEKLLRSKLNEEQLEIFEEYDAALSSINRISEKNAFVKGVKFATRFIFETLL